MVLTLKSPFSALALAFLIGLLPEISFAQESELVPREYHPIENHPTSASSNESLEAEELAVEDEKNSARPQTNVFVGRDSIVVLKTSPNPNKPVKAKSNNDPQKSLAEQKPAEKNNEEEEKDDSILSFNFLYYIFQKFKLSDIVDK